MTKYHSQSGEVESSNQQKESRIPNPFPPSLPVRYCTGTYSDAVPNGYGYDPDCDCRIGLLHPETN